MCGCLRSTPASPEAGQQTKVFTGADEEIRVDASATTHTSQVPEREGGGNGLHRRPHGHDPAMAQSLDGASIELEGTSPDPIETGHTDSADSTSLHVPSTGPIATDVVRNGHPSLLRRDQRADTSRPPGRARDCNLN